MKDFVKQLIDEIQDTNTARCIVREYLQARTLESLQVYGAFINWAFVGGTALRFLYSMPRFSEDLDFSLTSPGNTNFEELMKKVKNRFISEGYEVSIKARSAKTVQAAFIKYPGLLYELGLSAHSSETLSIKVEIDSNPPAGAHMQTSILRKYILLNLQHYDKSSLLAGKLHALSARKYTKGRDVYDLMWYLSDRTWPNPNITLLNNALKQTGWKGRQFTQNNWRKIISERITELDWNKVTADLRPFIEKQEDLQLLTLSNMLKLLENF